MEELFNQTSAYITPTHAHARIGAVAVDTIPWNHNNTSIPIIHVYITNNILLGDPNFILIGGSVLISLSVLALFFVIYGLYSLVKANRSAHVFVINLLISDLIEIVGGLILLSIAILAGSLLSEVSEIYMILSIPGNFAFYIGVLLNICFMVCISAERYVMIAHPVWYRNVNTIRASVCVAVAFWIIMTAIVVITFCLTPFYLLYLLGILLLPYPLEVFLFVGTWRALSRNTTLPPHDRRRIRGTLALVLFIYTVLCLPFAFVELCHLTECSSSPQQMTYLLFFTHLFMILNPFFDFLLYLMMRTDAKDLLSVLRLCVCCHKRQEENDQEI